MPDLNDDLFSSFKSEGNPVNPLPASEVRRRGDRMRRRNNVLASAGGVVAALVVIATPLAVVANQGSESSGRQDFTGPAQVAWRQTIPETVDVAAGMGGAASAAPEVSDQPGVATVEVCGETAFDALDGPVDVAGATQAGDPGTDDGGSARTLALYADGAAADAAVSGLVDAVRACSSEPAGDGDSRTYEVTGADLSADEAYVVGRGLQRAGEDYPEMVDYYVVAQTGNAVVVTEHPGTGPENEEFVQDEAVELVDQLAVFSEDAARAVESDDTADLSVTIPDDFPLLAGFPEQSAATGRQVGREGPSRDLDLEPYNPPLVEACGTTPTGLPSPVDTLFAGWRVSSIGMLRQLMTFGSEAQAQAYADATLQVFEACTEEDGGGLSRIHERSEEPGYGDFAASVVTRFEVDGEPGPGHAVVQVVRVGASVLLFTAETEGADPVDPATGATELTYTYLATNGPVIDAM
jgi:hypothetical protein